VTAVATNSAKLALIVEDDPVFGPTLQRALHRRGLRCEWVDGAAKALQRAQETPFDYAIVDLKLGEDSGLGLIQPLLQLQPRLRVLLLTGYASVATAVDAIKRGAVNYLPKPASADAILAALAGTDAPPHAREPEPAPLQMTPLARVEWEHIQQALAETSGNLSAAARLLGMHRRSLQRKLKKRPSPEG
jgi:two-component system response regulator RegA